MKHEIIARVIDKEGGYCHDPSDSGGETNFGITVKVARDCGYYGSMRDMPYETAYEIYDEKYWRKIRGDFLVEISPMVCEEVFDTAVNMGQNRAITFLQRVLNALNNQGRYWPDLDVDGLIGPKSLSALKACVEKRDERIVFAMLNCLQGAFYIELTERRPKDEKFIYGWFKNRVMT